MSVYVDNARIPYRRGGRTLLMCHMIADTPDELREMVARLDLPRSAKVQYPGTYREHFDICLSKRRRAVAAGAKEVTTLQIGRIMRARRGTA